MASGPYLSLNGTRVVTANILVPYYGAMVADITGPLPGQSGTGPQSLTIGNLTFACATYRSQSFAGEYRARLVGGFGGWHTQLAAQGYQNTGGILASTIASDAASAVGEQVNVTADYQVGQAWTREAAPASRTLRLLFPLWWVDVNGVAQCQATRPSIAIQSQFQAIDYDPGKGLFTITTEDPASWMPANTFQSTFLPGMSTISSSKIVCTDEGDMHLTVLSLP